jgi:hypothetical protein
VAAASVVATIAVVTTAVAAPPPTTSQGRSGTPWLSFCNLWTGTIHVWPGPSRPSVPSSPLHAFFAAPQVGPPFTPPLAPLPHPRAPPPQSSLGCRGLGSWIHSPLSAPSAPWSSLPPRPPPTGWPTLGASNHTTPYSGSISSPHLPSAFHPHSIVVGNGSILPVTSGGDSVLPRPFYLNDVLVALTLSRVFFSFVVYH